MKRYKIKFLIGLILILLPLSLMKSQSTIIEIIIGMIIGLGIVFIYFSGKEKGDSFKRYLTKKELENLYMRMLLDKSPNEIETIKYDGDEDPEVLSNRLDSVLKNKKKL